MLMDGDSGTDKLLKLNLHVLQALSRLQLIHYDFIDLDKALSHALDQQQDFKTLEFALQQHILRVSTDIFLH